MNKTFFVIQKENDLASVPDTCFDDFRYRKKKSIQQGTTQSCFNVLVKTNFGKYFDNTEQMQRNLTYLCVFVGQGWSNGAGRGHLIQQTVLTEPFRSRDDLLPERSHCPEAQRRQPPPDST